MLPTIKAVVEKDGRLRPLEPIDIREGALAIVTFPVQRQISEVTDTALLSEAALSDWNNADEEAAWDYLQKPQ